MCWKRLSFVFYLLVFLLSACVSKNKYLQLEAEYGNTQQKLARTENRLNYTEQSREKCIDSLADYQGRLKEGESEKSKLAQELEDMETDIRKRDSTIEAQTLVIRQLHSTKEKIETSLREQIEAQEIKLEEIEGKLKVTLVDKILFDTGKVEVSEKGKKVLLDLADSLSENRNQNIVVEGHTDDVPIGLTLVERYPTNWELSAARAIGVVRFLQEKGGLEPERLSAAGYSYYRPLASNETAKGRRKNRRIEITLMPRR